jgi:hypothetical protein
MITTSTDIQAMYPGLSALEVPNKVKEGARPEIPATTEPKEFVQLVYRYRSRLIEC